MSVSDYISAQDPTGQNLLSSIHKIIVKSDKSVDAKTGKMMGREMIIYNSCGLFKYGLAANKNYFSLHIMPIYGSPSLHNKYQSLLPRAKFQKGCINFNSVDDMPFDIVTNLIKDCSKIDLAAIKLKIQNEKLKR